MSDRDTKLIRQARSTRLTFPDDESRQAWLPLLLEAYAIVDAGINEAIRREEAQGRTLACHKEGAFHAPNIDWCVERTLHRHCTSF